ncbi:hypothetical protein HYE60_07510 [Aggregatibacter actinomycetemcomitans]|uniref:hypothetical protein n=1 Tax=Aggregatibacter actinomycetemcomitans TaxID=714 RepID=UPI00197BE37B|nr:hypothetical protein [Aggregatibacter actinomycetemcomitans]MBN6075089.1 hypothetical protein [Aggregatibacter actinomycetemcomitans]
MNNFKLSKYSRLGDLLHIGKEFNLHLEVLNEEDSKTYIDKTFNLFNPLKTWGHIQIGRGESLAPTEKYQNIYSLFMTSSPLFVIFDQNHKEDKNWVLKVKNGRDFAKLVYENGNLEYFLSDEKNTFLVAVNWYSIEYIGSLFFDKNKLDEFSHNNLEEFFM